MEDKIKQLKNAINVENEKYGKPEVRDTEVIEAAITFFHSHTFGKDVMESTVDQLEVIISSSIKLTMRNWWDDLAKAMNRLNYNSDKTLDSLYILMMSLDLIPNDQQKMNDLIKASEVYHDVVDVAIKKKNEG